MLATAAMSGLLLLSCQKSLEEDSIATDGLLRFEVSDTVQWVSATRAGEPVDTLTTQTRKIGDVWENGKQMYLHTSVEPMDAVTTYTDPETANAGAATRGTVINSGTFHRTIGLFAMAYNTSGGSASPFTPTFMYNVEAAGSGSGATTTNRSFSTAEKYFIPYGKTVKIFAMAPRNPSGLALPQSSASFSGGLPSYTVTVPEFMANQVDLCFAQATANSSNNGAATALNFEHAMAAVRFKVAAGVTSCTINRISIGNLYGKGTVTPFNTNGGWWSYQGEKNTTYSYTNGSSGISHTRNRETDVFESGNAMFLIPQALNGVTVTLEVTAGGKRRTLSTNLSGSWTKGNRYVYTLSFDPTDPTTFEVTRDTSGQVGVSWNGDGTIGTVTEPGGTYAFTIKSHKNGTPREYRVQYRRSDGTWEFLPGNSNTLLIGQNKKVDNGAGNFTQTLQVYEKVSFNNEQTTNLKKNTGVGGTSAAGATYLAKNGATANCYVVKGPGYYSFPTHMGNAMLNSGTPNESVLKEGKYKDYNDQPITLASQGILRPASVRVLWTDVANLISEITLQGQLITFNIPQATIQEGNAVIGAFDSSGKCMWSWHIWVTWDGLETISVKHVQAGGSKNVLIRPLGYVNAGQATWRNESLTIRFIQSDGNGGYNATSAKTFTIKQTGAQNRTIPGRYPVYQWGRKDPLLPISSDPNGQGKDATVYPGPDGNTDYLPSKTVLTHNGGSPFYWTSIQKPHLPYGFVLSDLYSKAFLWDASVQKAANNKDDRKSNKYDTKKSIYDPSPVGYKVAPVGTFDALAHNGVNYLSDLRDPAPNPLGPSGGYGYGWDTALNISQMNTTTKVVQFRNSGTTRPRPFPIALLGCRLWIDSSSSSNFNVSRFGTNFFTWLSGRRSYAQGTAFSVYVDDSNRGGSWIDLYGASTIPTFDHIALQNAYPLLVVQE